MVGQVGADPTTPVKETGLQPAAFADSLLAHIAAPILRRGRRHRRFFLFLKGVLVYALIHLWWRISESNRSEYPACKAGVHPLQTHSPCKPLCFLRWQSGGYIIHCVCNHSEELPFGYST